jgi:molybdopterin-containing oxidoreductase family membrane subunit
MFFKVRQRGPFAPIYWLMIFCNVVVPQIFWFKKARTNLLVIWVAALLVNVGMWCERFNIIVTSLHRDFLPSKWELYAPTWVDWAVFAGTIGLFSTLFLLFMKFVPAVAVTEVKELRHEMAHDEHAAVSAAGGGGH